jgi:glycerol-3-phosphate dehydrogenase subunit C
MLEVEDVRQTLDHCVKCNICTTACPVAAVTSLFPGPKFVGPQSERFRDIVALPDATSPDHSVDYCSGCGICSQVCPHGVKIAEINTRARATMINGKLPLRNRLIAQPDLLGKLGVPFAPLANLAFRIKPFRALMQSVIGIHRDAPLPPFARHTFQSWANRAGYMPTTSAASDIDKKQRTVVYFHGCSTNYYEPNLGDTLIKILQHNGIRVIVPPHQTCCGLPLQSNGDFAGVRSAAQKLIDIMLPYAEQDIDIVASSTSCGLMLKREYREITGIDTPDFRRVSERMWDICEYLWMLHQRGALKADFKPLKMTVPYHAPCQQKAHGIGKPALDLMSLIPELRVIEMTADCCGIAGTYGLKQEKYQISMDVGAKLFSDVKACQPDVAVCDSETCRWQITHGTGVRSLHPVQLLAMAYGLSDV